jgi:glycosyltransferase involved in cell wall biosynthesis
MPAVTVIMPVFNRPQLAERAASSVLAQTFRDFELIVVDDGSPLDLESMCPSFHHSQVRYLRQANGGPAAARNHGIAAARGQFISFLDSDDVLLPNNLADLYGRLLGIPHAGVAHGWATIVDHRGGELQFTRPNLEGRVFSHYLFQNSTPMGTILIRRVCFDTVASFDESLPLFEDWELLLRLSFHYDFTAVCKRVARIYHQTEQRSTSRPAGDVGLAARTAYEKLLDDPVARPHVQATWKTLMANTHVMTGHHYRVFEANMPAARREFLAALRMAPGYRRAYIGLVEASMGQWIIGKLRQLRSRLFRPGRHTHSTTEMRN